MNSLFRFENDFAAELRCIPMAVRLKLDTCGIKLKLAEWQHFSAEERRRLLEEPCSTPSEITAYRCHLERLVTQHTGAPPSRLVSDPEPFWLDADQIPSALAEHLYQAHHLTLTLGQWRRLLPLERFALVKLARSHHEHRNLTAALREFSLS